MAKTLDQIPRVLVIHETSIQPGRDKLQGIFKRRFGCSMRDYRNRQHMPK